MAGGDGEIVSEQLSDRGDHGRFGVRAFQARGSSRANDLRQEELAMFKR